MNAAQLRQLEVLRAIDQIKGGSIADIFAQLPTHWTRVQLSRILLSCGGTGGLLRSNDVRGWLLTAKGRALLTESSLPE